MNQYLGFSSLIRDIVFITIANPMYVFQWLGLESFQYVPIEATLNVVHGGDAQSISRLPMGSVRKREESVLLALVAPV